MEHVEGHHRGNQILTGDVAFHGLLEGNMTVPEGVTLSLHGMVNGDVRVEAGGTAEIHGMVNGAVINNGGDVFIYGTVDTVGGTHPSTIDPNAVINDAASRA